MIVTSINGGLGNQLFQYAFGKALSTRLGTSLLLDLSAYNDCKNGRDFALDYFNIIVEEAKENQIPFVKRKGYQKILLLAKVCDRLITPYDIYTEMQYHFSENKLHIPNNSYVAGYWQSEKYFIDAWPILKKEFTFNTAPNKLEQSYLSAIEKSNSVCLHIRRGDYLGHSRHPICSVEYYKSAINFINKDVSNPHLFIFSDDMDWVRKNFTPDTPHTLIENLVDWQELRLMTFCKNNIIANSSFSWWGAYLGTFPKKKVVAPKEWFYESKRYDTKDLIPLHWTKI